MSDDKKVSILRTDDNVVDQSRGSGDIGFGMFDRFVDPFFRRHLDMMRRQMDMIFPETRGWGGNGPEMVASGGRLMGTWNPRMDINETTGEMVVHAELPGVPKENVKMKIENNQVFISGEKNNSTLKEDSNSRIEERVWGKFERSFPLPKNAVVDKISAKIDQGVLEIKIPKIESEKDKARFIEIQ
ncbi:hypothetical protein BB559_003284 [Furculomyces boomerangus]|uniref:SHSP domain-containing protein n=2 Tax=Harpellales TaxID=61421 RepID=A0A2T9YM40_9FUNG|nr:hypothetical protein BB559_003284 [Furculomyces boomerangus]PWA00290.1 hypothetical protein BB558_003675 [Smittium angustum]